MGVPVALTLSDSDPSGAAGVQADLRTFDALGVYGTSVVASITVQSSAGLFARHDVPLPVFRAQVEALLSDLPPRAAKVGMLTSVPAIRLAARLLPLSGAEIVVDPVLATRDGAALLRPATLQALVHDLLPSAALLVVGPIGAQALTGIDVGTPASAKAAAMRMVRLGARAVLVTGARNETGAAVDGLLDGKTWHRFETAAAAAAPGYPTWDERQALSAAVTAWLARGQTLPEAVAQALARGRPGLACPHCGQGQGRF